MRSTMVRRFAGFMIGDRASLSSEPVCGESRSMGWAEAWSTTGSFGLEVGFELLWSGFRPSFFSRSDESVSVLEHGVLDQPWLRG